MERAAIRQDSAATGQITLRAVTRGAPANGGFPDPPEGSVVRVVRAMHDACGRKTRLRLPGALPSSAVRRVVCQGCAATFDTTSVEEVELVEPPGYAPTPASIDTLIAASVRRVEPAELEEAIQAQMLKAARAPETKPKRMRGSKPRAQRGRRSLSLPSISLPSLSLPSLSLRSRSLPSISMPSIPRPSFSRPSLSKPPFSRPSFSKPTLSGPSFSLPRWLRDPDSRTWRYLSVPIAALAVIVGLMAIQGGSDDSDTPFQAAAPPPAAEEAPASGGGKAAKGGSANLIRESSFSLALPDGWQRTSAAAGGTFAAVSPGGDADATLWVERDPQLTFPSFEARSLDTLRSLAGSARVVERVAAPTADATVIRLAADAPEGSPQYEVTLRVTGPYRYYLATTVQPDAPGAAVDGAELIHGSFVPSGASAQGGGGQG